MLEISIGNDEFNAFMRGIGADHIKAITQPPAPRLPENEPGFHRRGVTWSEVMSAFVKVFGALSVGHVTSPHDFASFDVDSGDVLRVVSFRPDPATLKLHDIVLYGAATRESLERNAPCTRDWVYTIGEIRGIHTRRGRARSPVENIIVYGRPGKIACERLGIQLDRRSYRRTGTENHAFTPLSPPFSDDVRAAGHIVAVVDLSTRLTHR